MKQLIALSEWIKNIDCDETDSTNKIKKILFFLITVLLFSWSDNEYWAGVKASASCRLIRRPRSLDTDRTLGVISPRLIRRFSIRKKHFCFYFKSNLNIFFTHLKISDKIKTTIYDKEFSIFKEEKKTSLIIFYVLISLRPSCDAE